MQSIIGDMSIPASLPSSEPVWRNRPIESSLIKTDSFKFSLRYSAGITPRPGLFIHTHPAGFADAVFYTVSVCIPFPDAPEKLYIAHVFEPVDIEKIIQARQSPDPFRL
jgi:hypothetical protein